MRPGRRDKTACLIIDRRGAMPVPPAMKRNRCSRGTSGNVNDPAGPRTARPRPTTDWLEMLAPPADAVGLDKEFDRAVLFRVFRSGGNRIWNLHGRSCGAQRGHLAGSIVKDRAVEIDADDKRGGGRPAHAARAQHEIRHG